MGDYFDEDKDGGNLAHEGRVMDTLSEHTVEGWLEGYVLSGRHGLLNSYEPLFTSSIAWSVHSCVIDGKVLIA